MPTLVTQRKATHEELESLANTLRNAPTTFQRFKQGIENAIVPWAVTSLLDAGQVQEERYAFTAAKRFQEPEHGGLIYFLRTVEGKVLTMFDAESQDLAMSEQDPLTSSFRSMSELVMVRSPNTGFVIGQTFSGDPLELGPPLEIEADPKDWPESETYCDMPWADLASRLGQKSTHAPADAGAV